MNYRILNRDEHFIFDGRPKRILALDGGGLRGILTLGILARIEALLAQRHRSPLGTIGPIGPGVGSPRDDNPDHARRDDFRLCHYFDLIAGTSTGAIIAAALAKGMTVAEVAKEYFSLGDRVFQKSLFRQGLLRAKYDDKLLSSELKRVYGPDTTLGGPELLTGLLVVTKRLDTGSPWPMANNPRGRYFEGNAKGRQSNRLYPLWQVVRASTAAPAFFDPELITIATPEGGKPLVGNFVDGGVSPFNNPALQALMYVTMQGYNVGWPTGADKLQLVSIGTGAADPAVAKASVTASHAIGALLSLMQDCASLQQTMLQWMSTSPTAREIDREVGDLRHDLIAGSPLVSYLRYDVDLRKETVQALDPTLTDDDRIEALSAMDAPENMPALHRLGLLAGERDVSAADFAPVFDLPRT